MRATKFLIMLVGLSDVHASPKYKSAASKKFTLCIIGVGQELIPLLFYSSDESEPKEPEKP